MKNTALNLFDPGREALKLQLLFPIPRLLDDAIDRYNFPPTYGGLLDLQTQPVISDKLAKFYGIGEIEGCLRSLATGASARAGQD